MTIDTDAQRAKLDSLTGFTPGPWMHVGWQPCGIYKAGDVSTAIRIATMDRRHEHYDNARLIVAAPDLLTCYRAALDEIDRLRELVAYLGGSNDDHVRAAELDRALDQINSHPDLKRALAVFYDFWGLDCYSPPALVEAEVRSLVKWVLHHARVRAALNGEETQ